MKRIFNLLCCILLPFSLVACQDAAPISNEPLNQQGLVENATAYFNQIRRWQSI